MVDVRMMMADMRKPGSPWSKVQFVGPEGGAELANSLLSIAEEVTKEKEKAA